MKVNLKSRECRELTQLVDSEIVNLIDTFSEWCGDCTDFVWVDGKELHEFMVSGGMWMSDDGYALCGRGVQTPEDQYFSGERFFYYMGAENEAEIEIQLGDEVKLYKGISEERVGRYFE